MVAVGLISILSASGTFALFNATTTNTGNTFISDDLTITNNGTCSGKSSSRTATCSSVVNLSNMIPGDGKLGKVTIKNGSGAAYFTLNFSVSATASTLLDQTPPNDTTTGGGLGLFIFV